MPSAAILKTALGLTTAGATHTCGLGNNGNAAAAAAPLRWAMATAAAGVSFMTTSALKAIERSVINPFDASKILVDEKGVFADGAKLIRGSFLFRKIDFELPFQGQLVYDGWWFWQRVTIDGVRVWSQISWLRIERVIRFRLPAELDSQCRECRIDIQFGPGLRIRRFQVTVAGIIAYDEIS